MNRTIAISTLTLGIGLSALAQQYPSSIASGTKIDVRTNDTIDVRNASDGRIYSGVVNNDVKDESGNIAIPKGSNAELIVRNVSSRNLMVDLESITVNGRRYIVSASDVDKTGGQGVGKNKRTGEYVGGGAVVGTVLGAIFGGGKGAAIGAASGAAAGAGTETLTKGRAVKISSESVLTFRLNQPMQVGTGQFAQDNGNTRNGVHYHNR